MKRKVGGDGDGGDHCVVGACGWFASCPPQTGGDPTEASSCVSVKWQRFEVSFGLLDVCLPGSSFIVRGCDKRAHREFGECDRRDQWFGGERIGVLDPPEQDKRAGVENPSGHRSEGGVEYLVKVAP
jgi:hypothetical protein